MEIKIDFIEKENILQVTLFPCPDNFLFSFFKDIKILNLEKIDIGIFDKDDNENNDVYINNDNYSNSIGTINTINVINEYLQQYDIDTYNIYKLFFQIKNVAVQYDDDALLVLNIKMESAEKMINYAQSIIQQYVSTIINEKNIDFLL
ncbi:MAG: hypothetical protein LBG92_12620 [Prevotellaceae bacterium]|jgi:hypothetical protein|nr:hypothetical protein [Prevotellaceae bacterium]